MNNGHYLNIEGFLVLLERFEEGRELLGLRTRNFEAEGARLAVIFVDDDRLNIINEIHAIKRIKGTKEPSRSRRRTS